MGVCTIHDDIPCVQDANRSVYVVDMLPTDVSLLPQSPRPLSAQPLPRLLPRLSPRYHFPALFLLCSFLRGFHMLLVGAYVKQLWRS